MPFQTDEDWRYLDRVVSLAGEMIDAINRIGETPAESGIKEITDDPDVLHRLLKIESAALIIRKTSRDYRDRLRQLKDFEKEVEKLKKTEAQTPQTEKPAGANGRLSKKTGTNGR